MVRYSLLLVISSEQAPYPSPPAGAEGSLTSLLLLSPLESLRWIPAGAPQGSVPLRPPRGAGPRFPDANQQSVCGGRRRSKWSGMNVRRQPDEMEWNLRRRDLALVHETLDPMDLLSLCAVQPMKDRWPIITESGGKVNAGHESAQRRAKNFGIFSHGTPCRQPDKMIYLI